MTARPVRLEPVRGRSLRDLIFDQGVEFPCGGTSACGGCRVRVLEGDVPITPEMRQALTSEELAEGWRLGCLAQAEGPVLVEIAQWSVEVLDDRGVLKNDFEPRAGRFGAAIDLGTTTIVTQLVDLGTGEVVGVEAGLNPQARFGSDLMTRIRHDLAHPGELTAIIHEALGGMLGRLSNGRPLEDVILVGNTAMHHLCCGLDVEPLARVPFRSPTPAACRLNAARMRWPVDVRGAVLFLPCIGGFVGSDVLAGLVATGLFEAPDVGALMDLGTNGEIAVGSRAGIVCASTAAGPAFEGGRIGTGMRAGQGAIDRVWVEAGELRHHVIGGEESRGICGSGLVDAAACGLSLGWIAPSGRIATGMDGKRMIRVAPNVRLSQADVRELQLAKGAAAAGLDLLLDGRRIPSESIHLAGAFGNYIRPESARSIGLLPPWAKHPQAAGNSAVRGARQLLLAGPRRDATIRQVLAITRHVELASHPGFQDAFVDAMRFPVGYEPGTDTGEAVASRPAP